MASAASCYVSPTRNTPMLRDKFAALILSSLLSHCRRRSDTRRGTDLRFCRALLRGACIRCHLIAEDSASVIFCVL
jgi:hypothetical protein